MKSGLRWAVLIPIALAVAACAGPTATSVPTPSPEPAQSGPSVDSTAGPAEPVLPTPPSASSTPPAPIASATEAVAAAQPNATSPVVAQIGGLVMGLAGRLPYLYLTNGSGLTILDATNPVQPVQIGQASIADATFQDIAVDGKTAFLAGSSGLWTVDISDPKAPRPIGFTGSISQTVALVVQDGLAYVAARALPGPPVGRNGLAIVDVMNPVAPRVVGSLDLALDVLSVAVRNGLAYLGVPGGIQVVDVSAPGDPKIVGFYAQESSAVQAVALQEDRAYTVSPNDFGVLDLVAPAAPRRLGGLAVNGFDVAVVGATAFVSTNGLASVDVSDPISPTAEGWYWAPASAEDVFLAQPYAYLVVNRDDLHVIDIADPAQLARVGGWEVVPGVPSREDPSVVTAAGTLGQAIGAAIANHHLYVVERDGGLWVFDLADPAAPRPVAFKELPGDFEQLTTLDNLLIYVAKGGLWMVDVSDPTAPRIEATCCPVGATFLDIQDGIGYLATWENGLHILDMADPAHPVEIGVFASDARQVEVTVLGDVAYVAEAPTKDPQNRSNWLGGGLRIVDISDPTAPQEITFVDTPGWIEDMAVVGARVYLAEGGGGGVRVFDVSNPANPVEERVYDTRTWPFQVMMVDAGRATVPIDGALYAFDWPEKGAAPGPVVLAQAGNGAVAGGYVYVPALDQGLIVLRLPSPSPAP